MSTSDTTYISWEYLMPKRKERIAGYIRESDISLAESITLESQAKAIADYAKRVGYTYEPKHEYKEAISGYTVPYMERVQLVKMLDAAKRREFDVLVVTEVRAISRRQVEIFIVYDLLQKAGIRLETISESFEDSAMGRIILGLRAGYAEIEREQMNLRLMRGRKSRNEIGHAPNGHPNPAYGYVFVDTPQEVKGAYEFDHTVIFVDEFKNEWTPYLVIRFIFDLLVKETSMRGVTGILNGLGIPPPQKVNRNGEPGHWHHGSIHTIVKNPIYIGEVWVNRIAKIINPRTGKKNTVIRPKEEWYLLPEGTAPALIDREMFEKVQQQLCINKEEAARNNAHPREEYGLLRAGYIFCGICGCRMRTLYPSKAAIRGGTTPWYYCHKLGAAKFGRYKHRVQIHIPMLDKAVQEKIIEVLQHPSWVRERVVDLRKVTPSPVESSDIEATVENISQQMKNLFNLAQHATDDNTIAELTIRMNDLERQKRAVEGMLYDKEDEDKQQALVEAEIVKFEQWVETVKPKLTDPDYHPTYEELRLAVRIIGIHTTVYPSIGDYPFRYMIEATVPEAIRKLLVTCPVDRY